MKKNSFQYFLTLFFLVFCLIGCFERKVTNINAKGKNIICFGDSVTFGYGAGPGEDYPTALAKMVSIPVINSGIDGDTSSEALRRLDADILAREPLLVIIEFCGNDFLRKVPIEETVKNIKEMVERIRASGAMVAIADVSSGMFLKEYNEAFSKLAKAEGAIFIPCILRGIITNPSMKSDFLHPNAAGYKMIAYRVHRVILPYLNQNRMSREFKKEG